MGMIDFQQDVLTRSFEMPVVVDFWAPWCAPCRVLGPTIEQLAQEQAGQWALVKVNTEEAEDLARQYQIRSIPNVKMFYQGKVIAEFAGALPRKAILDWLDEHLPNDAKQAWEAIRDAVANGDPEAVAQLQAYVADNPANKEASLLLAQQLIWKEPAKALALVEAFHQDDLSLWESAEELLVINTFLAGKFDDSPAGKALTQAQGALAQGDHEQFVLRIIQATMADKNYVDELPRRLAIAVFHTWGAQHPLTRQYRRRFDMALY